MSERTASEAVDVEAVADEAFSVLNSGRQIATFSSRLPVFDFDAAYRVTAVVRARREAAGSTVVGRKIGFTNRTIWDEYHVSAPMWGYVYDTTAWNMADLDGAFPLAGYAEPRIEPEIIFGLGAAPAPGMNEHELLGCIDWVAHGFEVVQSIYPGWAFTLPDTVAAYGLHGALLIGPRHDITGNRDGKGANVLDGPLSALRHFNEVLAVDPVNPPLAAGDLVTTGTLTRAFPIVSGETWSTLPQGIGLDGIEMRFE